MPDIDDLVIEISPDGSYDCTPETLRRLSAPKQTLWRGQKVLIHGLKSKPELNGLCATIKSYNYDNSRYSVTVVAAGHTQTLALKETNLQKITPAKARAIAKEKAEAADGNNIAKVDAITETKKAVDPNPAPKGGSLGKGFDEEGEFHEERLMESDDDEGKDSINGRQPSTVKATSNNKPKPKKKSKKKDSDAAVKNSLEHNATLSDTSVVIVVELTSNIKSMAQLSLDVYTKQITLHETASNSLLLKVALPEMVDPDKAKAKFSKKKNTLTVTITRIQ
jgi:hypothetical protein